MASLTLTQFIAEVVLACRNLSTADPYYPQITSYLTRARNKIIRKAIGPRVNIDLFPELHNSWTIGPTYPNSIGIVGNVIAKPADCIAVTGVQRAQLATLPDWSVTREIPLIYQEPQMFGVLSKDTTTANYASIYTRKGKSIIIFPTPDALHIDYLRVYGIKSETALVNAGDVFFSDEQWDDATVLRCAAMIQKRRGWDAAAASLMEEFQEEFDTANVSGLEEISHVTTLHASGGATRSGTYFRS